MHVEDLDLDGTGNANNQNTPPPDDINKEGSGNQGDGSNNNGGNNNPPDDQDPNKQNQGGDNNQQIEKPLYEEGTEIETPDGKFTVDANGNLLKEDGSVFKEAKDIKSYLDGFSNEEDVTDGTIEALQALVNEEIVDENGNPIEFTDDDEGKKSYIGKVIEKKQKEAYDSAVNNYFENNPIVKQFADYVELGGNPAEFGQIKDRSSIEFDPNNANQHKDIIRTAWKEDNRKGDVESYINYLESGGTLADVAKSELEGIKAKDAEYKKQIAEQAAAAREQDRQTALKQIQDIYDKVSVGVVGDYKIPETITIEKDGKKVTKTRDDFFNYLVRNTPNGKTAYQNDIDNLSDEQTMNEWLLDGWLKFTGGSYKNIVEMAINSKEVEKLRFVAKKHAKDGTSSVRVTNTRKDKPVHADDIL